jgi:iron complex transport system substrate-binding protein
VPRIVSLIASATEIVDALGMLDDMVGRSHECDYPERVRSLPVCPRPRIDIDADSREIDRQVRASAETRVSIYDVFDDVIESLDPTHILTQIQCEVCAVSLRDIEAALARGLKSRPRIVSLQPNSLAEIWDDVRRVARALAIEERGEGLVRELQSRMERLTRPVAGAPPLRVACVEWIEPLMTAGHWMPELVAMAGGVNISAGTWAELVAAEPDAIVVAPCGFDLSRAEQEMYWLTRQPDFERFRSRVFVADGNQYFNRPGPRVVETFEILLEILRPGVAGGKHRGVGWRDMMSR